MKMINSKITHNIDSVLLENPASNPPIQHIKLDLLDHLNIADGLR